MNLCFLGSGKTSAHLADIEIETVVRALRLRFDLLYFGGSNTGLMGTFARSFRDSGGAVVSVVPGWLQGTEEGRFLFKGDDVRFCKDTEQTKSVMFGEADGIICYPGGLGTMDELFSYLASQAVKERRPLDIFLYNFQDYFSPLLAQLERGTEMGLIKGDSLSRLYRFEDSRHLRMLLSDDAA